MSLTWNTESMNPSTTIYPCPLHYTSKSILFTARVMSENLVCICVGMCTFTRTYIIFLTWATLGSSGFQLHLRYFMWFSRLSHFRPPPTCPLFLIELTLFSLCYRHVGLSVSKTFHTLYSKNGFCTPVSSATPLPPPLPPGKWIIYYVD